MIFAIQIFADFEVVSSKSSGSKQFRLEKLPRSFNVIESDDLKINCVPLNRTEHGFNMDEIEIK
jgi:hypothetical protein